MFTENVECCKLPRELLCSGSWPSAVKYKSAKLL